MKSKKNNRSYVSEILLGIAILILLIMGYNIIRKGTDDYLVMLFPLSIFLISIIFAFFLKPTVKFNTKENIIYGVIILIYIILYVIGSNILLNGLTFAYKHKVSFLGFKIYDNTMFNLYNAFFSAFFCLIGVLYYHIMTNIKEKKKPKRKYHKKEEEITINIKKI